MSDRWARGWFGLTGMTALVAVAMQVALTAGQSGGHFTTPGSRAVNLFFFFTIQSNLLVAVTNLLLGIDLRRSSGVFSTFRLIGLIAITITALIYHAVLAGLVHVTGWAVVADQMLHTAVPALAIGGWLLFGPRGLASWRIAALTLLFPLCWLIVTLIRGALIGWYPYPFIDVGKLGYPRVIGNASVIAVLFYAISAGAAAIDRRLPRRQARPDQAAPSGPRVRRESSHS